MTIALANDELLSLAWVDVCAVDDLENQRGACVLVDNTQVALFRVAASTDAGPNRFGAMSADSDETDEVFALHNIDPFSGAGVLSRGIVGSRGGELKVASPVYKQNFSLRTGECLDDDSIGVACYPVRISEGRVQVAIP